MWDVNTNSITDPDTFDGIDVEYTRYYQEHLQQWNAIVAFTRELFARNGMGEALMIAKPTALRGSICLRLAWRPIYPYAYEHPKHNDEDEWQYNNTYLSEYMIASNGCDGQYMFTIGYSVLNDTEVLAGSVNNFDYSKSDKVALAEWFKADIIKTTKATMRKVKAIQDSIKPSLLKRLKKALTK